MARRSEVGAVYTAAVVQGLALVTFPAASTILTSSSYYGLSRSQYGGIFLPQAACAIGASLLGAGLARAWGTRRIFLIGLLATLLSMVVFLLSQRVMTTQPLVYGLLLVATACLGVGFGLTVPSLNTLVAAFFPATIDRAVLMLNALLGLGTVLAPVLVAVFLGLGDWSGLPLSVAVVTLVLLLFSVRLPLQARTMQGAAPRVNLPARFWAFAGFATLYGVVETMSGNWATLYMANDLATSSTAASLALTAFWSTVTVGRVMFALLERPFPERTTFRVLPFVAAAAFVVIAALPSGS